MRWSVIAMLLLTPFAAAPAADWLEFRGPAAQGHTDARDLPLKWSATEGVVWNTPVEGLGWSSPVVVGAQIFLTTAVPDASRKDGLSLRTVALDAESGAVVWNTEVFAQTGGRAHSKNSHASATPTSDGQHLFVHFGPHGTACLTLTGAIVWKNSELSYAPVHGNGGSPVLVGDRVIVSCDGGDSEFIVALHKATGKTLWKVDRTRKDLTRKFAFGTPLVIEVAGRTQVVSQGAGAVYAYQPEDGTLIWSADYGEGYSVVPRPVFAHGLLYVATGYDRPKLLAIDPTGRGDVTPTHIRWTMTKAAPLTPSPLVVGDELYVVSDNGIVTCLDAKTGDVIWQERIGGAHSASPTAAEGRIYIQSEDGESIVLQAGRTFVELSRSRLEPRTFASYAVYRSSWLIRTEKGLYRIGKAG